MSKKHKKESYQQLELNFNPVHIAEVDMKDMEPDPVLQEEIQKAVKKIYEKNAVVAVAKLNLREEPTKESKVIMILEGGTKLHVEECQNDEWYFVSVNHKIQGYVIKEFVEVYA